MGRPAREKGPDAFRTIGEAAEEVGVAAHVLRFWETKFSGLRPLKRGGSRRYYRPRDIELLHQIKHLLHDEGYTIKGAAKALRTGSAMAPAGLDGAEQPTVAAVIQSSDAPELPLPSLGAEALPAAAYSRVETIRNVLESLAAECVSVAAGNSPPRPSD